METTLKKNKIGDPLDRIDGRLKVTGGAKYAVEYNFKDIAFGVLVTSTIAKGRIKSIDTKAAEKAPGVLAVITHLNSPKVPGYERQVNNEESRVYGQEFRVFYDDKIYFNNQPIALAIADTFERANYAASLIKVQYEVVPHETDIKMNLGKSFTPQRPSDHSRGDASVYKTADVVIDQEYITPIQVHNPMETHAATALWEGEDKVTVYNKTQAVKIAQNDIMRAFDLKEENVQIHSPFVGGAFGSSSRVWPQEMAALLGAKKTGRPVKVALKREQQFNMVGYRPMSIQKVGLGATKDGKLIGMVHDAQGFTSTYEQFTERILDPSKSLYGCENMKATYRLVPLDVSTPCWTRGPGESSGSFALESAMDELAYALKMDPIELRLKNFAESDPEKKKPWSSNFMKECYQQGAEKFGWSKRTPEPRSMKSGNRLVGMGMSAGIYKSDRSPASARAKISANGSLLVQSATADVGPGTYTIMTQIAADVTGIDVSNVRFELGNSMFPKAPGQFGSHTATSVGSAVYDVCEMLIQKLQEMAISKEGSPFYKKNRAEMVSDNGSLTLISNKAIKISYADILKLHQLPELVVVNESKGPEEVKHSGKSFCANFVEVHVHPLTGMVKVTKVVSVVDAGRIINKKTATSQVLGSAVWGVGMALMEEGMIDHRYGRYMNKDLAEYHVPTNADINNLEIIFIDKLDPFIDPIGAKGLGEIGLVGFTAAVANAVFHATGKRFRELPITPDKVIEAIG
jgi:xanthine dehydrogenase YagR molybdenum-binding subunit